MTGPCHGVRVNLESEEEEQTFVCPKSEKRPSNAAVVVGCRSEPVIKKCEIVVANPEILKMPPTAFALVGV